MSSRLQVGGLALIIKGATSDKNVGKVVELTSYLGDHKSITDAWFTDGTVLDNVWVIESDDLVCAYGNSTPFIYCESKNLMPLGDQQTQDELRKEQEELTCKN